MSLLMGVGGSMEVGINLNRVAGAARLELRRHHTATIRTIPYTTPSPSLHGVIKGQRTVYNMNKASNGTSANGTRRSLSTIKVAVGADDITITIPVSDAGGKRSRSGNSTILATTHGQQFLGRVNGADTYLQLNLMQVEEHKRNEGKGIEIVPTKRSQRPYSVRVAS